MFYASKLMQDAAMKQEQAMEVALGFSEPLLQAMELADHFSKIQADEYVIPVFPALTRDQIGTEKTFGADFYTAL